MTEIIPDSSFLKEIRSLFLQKYRRPGDKALVEAFASSPRYTFIAAGSESIVVSDNKKPGRVLAFEYKGIPDPLKARKLFYRHRVAHILFPYNFPRFYASFGAHPGKENLSGTVRQKIEFAPRGTKACYPLSRVLDIFENYDTYGIYFWLDPGFSPPNFRTGIDGGEYYLDKIDREVKFQIDKCQITIGCIQRW